MHPNVGQIAARPMAPQYAVATSTAQYTMQVGIDGHIDRHCGILIVDFFTEPEV